MGDGTSDKYEFKALAVPPPDDITTRFNSGRSRIVEGSLTVYVQGVETAPTGTVDYEHGTFDLPEAPPKGAEICSSFAYQWFKDAELTEFLLNGIGLLGLEDIAGVAVGLRPVALDFACGFAYMRKAAEYAESVTASAGGGDVDQSRISPNWLALANTSFKAGADKLEIYKRTPAGAQIRFLTFKLPTYVPQS